MSENYVNKDYSNINKKENLISRADEYIEEIKFTKRMNLAKEIWEICKLDNSNNEKAVDKIMQVLEDKGL